MFSTASELAARKEARVNSDLNHLLVLSGHSQVSDLRGTRMLPDNSKEAGGAQSDSPLVLRHLAEWRERLLSSDIELGAKDLETADAAGLQLILSALMEESPRLRIKAGYEADYGSLWHRLGLNDLADALPVTDAGSLVGVRPHLTNEP
ncbi:hypothetical protein FHG66_21160 [Rubellimicrobium rubrum]|uniref:STAS domain-containing protein n=1 Tax=Rubellimicrobium rubrum TaxID=2585369 RepID=A0A5C4MGN8_9RHOB|nr:hypothetical protein [Rubellimicrobium rubrum]TNC43145.1 hypothetical protein FHG66_21160 [Rubellimicrobium rubrum]